MDLSSYIYLDDNHYYFDPENYTDEGRSSLTIDYEDGDIIKWKMDNKKFIGVLREVGVNLNLFRIENVSILK
jgi:hypothetical protein